MTQTFRLNLSGMTCASCVGRAEKAIASADGVQVVAINLANESATIEGDLNALPAIVERLSVAGYPAVQSTVRLQVDGMTCASCVGRVERVLIAESGVLSAMTSSLHQRTCWSHSACSRLQGYRPASTSDRLSCRSKSRRA